MMHTYITYMYDMYMYMYMHVGQPNKEFIGCYNKTAK